LFSRGRRGGGQWPSAFARHGQGAWLRAIIWELVHYCAANGVTPLINGELRPLLGEQSPEEAGIATMVDNVVMLDRGAAPLGDPSITVIKTRRSAHSRGAHGVIIDEMGFHISGPITSLHRSER
jgi:hypothetical protein